MNSLVAQVFSSVAVLFALGAFAQPVPQPAGGDQCRKNLERIYGAIQEYRKEHKSLPGYFHDLVPAYLSKEDADQVFLCPVGEQAGAEHPFPHLADPQVRSHYIYEFSARETGSMWEGGAMTMAEWKSLQMTVVGGSVPILRCWQHTPRFNISFDGDFFESPDSWEYMHLDKVNLRDLSPPGLRARLLGWVGQDDSEEAAFEGLRAAAMLDSGPIPGEHLSEDHKRANARLAQQALAAYSQAEKFLADFPESERATEVRAIRRQMLFAATQSGDESARQHLEGLVEKATSDKSVPEDERFELKAMLFFTTRPDPNDPSVIAKARKLVAEFPDRTEPYFILLQLGQEAGEEKGRAVAEEIARNTEAPEAARRQATGILKRMSIQGQPLEMRFVALDGREVDLAEMKGKVVLVDFWATWCGPCVAELPKVKAAYEELHPKGFEIIGISFDNSKSALEEFIKREKMPWPQYFDGEGWQNKFGQQFGINSIPTMWLVDKEGRVADANARHDLVAKVERLLAK